MENYGIMDKPMVLWTKLWYYGKNYGIIMRTMELRFTKGKNFRLSITKKLIYSGKPMVIYQNN